jgi:hypothetical protein
VIGTPRRARLRKQARCRSTSIILCPLPCGVSHLTHRRTGTSLTKSRRVQESRQNLGFIRRPKTVIRSGQSNPAVRALKCKGRNGQPQPFVLADLFQGLAVITVFKAGFLGSGRFGSGIVVARLSDGTWSAPSAIGTIGGGFGGQIGFELTDFVFILNDYNAVKTFSQAASVTLGGNVSIAAGPVGRNAEGKTRYQSIRTCWD